MKELSEDKENAFRAELQNLCDKYNIEQVEISLDDEGTMETFEYALRDKPITKAKPK